jgi:hypothetical protein
MESLPEVEVHPFADMVPQMTDEEFATLRADIRAHGVQVAVTLYEGKVLDGRHRLRAVRELRDNDGFQVALPTQEFIGNDTEALHYVVSTNLHRRHLTTGQKALLAAELQKQLQAKIPAPERGEKGKFSRGGKFATTDSSKTRDEAGKATGVSGRSVDAAANLIETAPDLAAEVRSGSMSLNAAVTESKEPVARAIRVLKRYQEKHAAEIPLTHRAGFQMAVTVLEKLAEKDSTL